jgi:uncharacterized UPF0160 family protein
MPVRVPFNILPFQFSPLVDLVRTRDQAKLDTCDIVVDVGAVYDSARERYDHHQRGFTEVFGHGFVTKLSSAGLVYKCVSAICQHGSVLTM